MGDIVLAKDPPADIAEIAQQIKAAQGNDAARLFLELMIEHHQGATEAAKAELENGRHGPVRALAASIATSQAAEIE